MAKNISLLGADYQDVPAVVLPKTGGGSAMFVDADDVNNVENALAIVVDGNNAPKAITKGQYLFIKNHSTLATGGYHATANIYSGGAVSGSNVSADADGIANSLASRLAKMNFRGNFAGLARNDGRVNITIPVQGDFTSISANKTTDIGGTIYGSIGAAGCTFAIEDLSISSGYIYMNLRPNITLSNYTDLAKITLVSISDASGVVFTMS